MRFKMLASHQPFTHPVRQGRQPNSGNRFGLPPPNCPGTHSLSLWWDGFDFLARHYRRCVNCDDEAAAMLSCYCNCYPWQAWLTHWLTDKLACFCKFLLAKTMVCLSTRVGLLWISLRFKALDVGVGLWEGKNRCFFLSRYCTALSLIFLLLLFVLSTSAHGHRPLATCALNLS